MPLWIGASMIGGILLGRADPSATAGSVAAFVANETQRATMANAGRARVQREFAYDAMIAGYEQPAGTAERQPQPA